MTYQRPSPEHYQRPSPEHIGTELDLASKDRNEITSYLADLVPEMQKAMPSSMSGDRMARLALNAIRQSHLQKLKRPNSIALDQCTIPSFAGCLLTASALGLEPGVAGQAFLVPFRDTQLGINECTLIIGYQGVAELAYRHPRVRVIRSGTMYESDPEIDDQPIGSLLWQTRIATARLRTEKGKRGDVIGYWASVQLTTGGEIIEVLSPDEVQSLRGGKIGPSGDIKDPMRWMEKKTVVKQALKLSPRSIEVHWAQQIDEQGGNELYVQQIPRQIADQLALGQEGDDDSAAAGSDDQDPGDQASGPGED